jgi:hypothetical protein
MSEPRNIRREHKVVTKEEWITPRKELLRASRLGLPKAEEGKARRFTYCWGLTGVD